MKIDNINVQTDETEFNNRELNLKDCYPVFFGNAYLEFSRKNSSPNIHEFYRWEKDINDITENIIKIKFIAPLFRTCKRYYDAGCEITKINSLYELILSGFFGAGLGICFTPFFPIGIVISILSLIMFIVLIKKKK